jgi:hypothetical protein
MFAMRGTPFDIGAGNSDFERTINALDRKLFNKVLS